VSEESKPDLAEKVVGVEILISNLLRAGVVSALVVIVAGLVLLYVGHPEYMRSSEAYGRLIHPTEAPELSPASIIEGALRADGASIITIGFLILALTPVLRVALSLVVFIYQKDRIFTLITLAVLIILIGSFLLGKAVH
jgi:uncharacterized membrane protein